MKILCFYTDEEVKNRLEKEFQGNIFFFKGMIQNFTKNDFEKYSDIEIITSFISSIFTSENIDKFPNLKMIATRSTGTDHIDLKYCQKKNIFVKNVPDYGSHTVAEYTFALLLALSRKVFYSYQKVKLDLNFSRRGMQEIRGFDLAGKTIGIIGTGKIGQNVMKIAQGFQMNILAFDVCPDKNLTQKINFKYVEINELLKKSDIISLHIPACSETFHFIDKQKLEKMKNGVVIINTSRGNIIDSKSLYEALQTKKIKALGLDVLEQENYLGREERITNNYSEEIININKELVKMDNVIITPHNAFNTTEALERI